MRRLEVLTPTVHRDDRGRIVSYVPPDAILEYNLVTIEAGSMRGLHWHPHFTEYLLFVSGEGRIVARDIQADNAISTAISPGLSTRAESGVAHAVYADTDLTFIAMLTRPWDQCDPPIIPFDPS